MTAPKTSGRRKRAFTDEEHDFVKACAKAEIPFDWIDRALGRKPRVSASHAKSTGIKPSVWKGRISYHQHRRLKAKFAMICGEFTVERGMKLKRA